MYRSCNKGRILGISILFLSWALSPPAIGAEVNGSSPTPVTVSDPAIPLDELDMLAAPMTVEELEVEADAWLKLVQEAARQVSDAKLRIKRQDRKKEAAQDSAEDADGATEDHAKADAAAEAKDRSLEELTALREERTELIDRLDVVLTEINEKIGLDENGKEKEEVLVYRRYINAVGGIKVDVSDTETAVASILGWLQSDEGGIRWARNIATFVAIVIAFAFAGRLMSKAMRKALTVGKTRSVLLTEFLVNSTRRVMLAIGIIVGLSALEVNIGPLLAVIGAAGFVVAFALQNTLSNFASGIMIMLYRPFDVDDVIEAAGVSGKVQALSLVSTTIGTFDNKTMLVPNNEIWGNIITNATSSPERRVDMTFGIGYDDDIALAKRVLEEIVEAHPKTLGTPAPTIELNELADSSVNFICRPWTRTEDYWTVYWDVTRGVKERFDAEGISIPFPQRDVHLYRDQAGLEVPSSEATKPSDETTARAGDQMGLDEDSNGADDTT